MSRMDGLEMNISEGQVRLSSLETKLDKQGSDGLDMCKGGRVDILNKRC